MEAQDLALLRALFQAMAKRLREGPLEAALEWSRILCYLCNTVLLEAPQLLRTLLMAMHVTPEALPVCFEFIPAFGAAMEMLPELLAKDTSKAPQPTYRLYYVDLAAWLATKYPTRRLEPFIAPCTDGLKQSATNFDTCMQAFTIGARMCLALPQMALETVLPVLGEVLGRAEGQAMERGGGVDALRVAMARMDAVLQARRRLETRYIYNKMPSCI